MQTVAKQTTKWFLNPYEFSCTINGESLGAKVVAEVPNPCHYSFVIAFSNGKEICFTSIEGGWIADKGLHEYELPIEREMDTFFSDIYLSGKCA